jgi:Lar family restriction alleviation protein
MKELKRCPFCGSKAELVHHSGSYGYYSGSYGVKCTKCVVKTATFQDEAYTQATGHYSVSEQAKAQAIDAWDTRYV